MSSSPEILRCPRCRGELDDTTESRLACRGCAESFPVCAGIPWLFRDGPSSLAQWSGKLQFFQATQGGVIKELEQALLDSSLLTTTRTRLERLKLAHETQLAQVVALVEPFELDGIAPEATLPRDRIPSQQHFGSYFETIFRDWAWGESEIRDAAELVKSQLDATANTVRDGQRLLVLGGGAGRLSCELARAHNWSAVVQLDINPLLTRVGSLLANGRSLELTEIPKLPAGLDSVAIDHVLEAPALDARVQFVVGDVFAPPFEPDSFDVLVTPWLIDILPEDFRSLSKRLNQLLKRGAEWISFGPLSFECQPSRSRYTREEVVEALSEAELTVEAHEGIRVPYLHSPHGSQQRSEEILAFRARKLGSVGLLPEFSFYPDWMRDPSLSVPRLAAWQRMQHERIFDVEILGLIDGRSSIQDIVKALSRKYSLAPDRCVSAVNRFFSSCFEKERER